MKYPEDDFDRLRKSHDALLEAAKMGLMMAEKSTDAYNNKQRFFPNPVEIAAMRQAIAQAEVRP